MTRFPLSTLLILLLAMPGGDALGAPLQLGQTGQFKVEVRGTVDTGAKIYRSMTPPPAFLVHSAAFPRPVFITTAPTMGRLLDPARVTPDPADPEIVKVDRSGFVENLMTVRIEGSKLIVSRDGISMTLVPAPPVLGERTLEQLVEALPEYRRNARYYTAVSGDLDKLRAVEQPAELLVFFGSWCSHCDAVVPRLVRVLQDARPAKLTVRFHGVPQDEGGDPVVDQFRVSALPTGIIRRGDKEIARMENDAWNAPETSLAAALAAPRAR